MQSIKTKIAGSHCGISQIDSETQIMFVSYFSCPGILTFAKSPAARLVVIYKVIWLLRKYHYSNLIWVPDGYFKQVIHRHHPLLATIPHSILAQNGNLGEIIFVPMRSVIIILCQRNTYTAHKKFMNTSTSAESMASIKFEEGRGPNNVGCWNFE